MWWLRSLIIFGLFILYTKGQIPAYKICALKQYEDTACSQLMRGTSEIVCQTVQDSIECAQRIINGTADFGYFSAENTLHLAVLDWEEVTVVNQMRHVERPLEPTDFESVVIVSKDHKNGLEGLRDKKYCHPGLKYDKTQRWTERVLKYFERKIVSIDCQISKSVSEIEVNALDKYFDGGCRPGKWSHDTREDAVLKRKYPKLCSLCDDSLKSCDYSDSVVSNPQQQALNCLKRGGEVAYVSKYETQKFFRREPTLVDNFAYLCKNGSMQSVNNNTTPCTWLREPWGVILAKSEKSVAMSKTIESWLNRPSTGTWQDALKELMGGIKFKSAPTTMQFPKDYLNPYLDGELPYAKSLCESNVSWCTTSEEERQKCLVVSTGGITSGVYPIINCPSPRTSVVHCLDDINKTAVDFMGIDSNYGYLARNLYNLSPALYFETEKDQYSSIVVVIREGSKFNSFESLKGSKVCLPEFGSTPSLAFINLGKNRGFFKKNECRYSYLLKNYFGESCAPGARDLKHERKMNQQDSLCALCKNDFQPSDQKLKPDLIHKPKIDEPVHLPLEDSCAASPLNRYFGNQGALRCLSEVGEVAILELQSLKDHAAQLSLNEQNYRIICRNGTLANRPGFDVELDCALTTIADGEIITRRKSEKTMGIVNVLTALDTYFLTNLDFKMYNIYGGEKHLLFKDSTIGLIASDEENRSPSVQNYVKLFQNLEGCVQGGSANILPINLIAMILISLVLTMRYF